jgi:primosomal protein N' (replication factor Y)
MAFARITLNLPSVSGVFDYKIPPELEDILGPGHLVTVPFGQQTIQGVVLKLVNQPAVADTRLILNLLDPLPVLTSSQIELARQISQSSLNSLSAILDLFLPSGLSRQADVLYTYLKQPTAGDGQSTNSIQTRLVKLLKEKSPLRGRQIDRHFSRVDWRKSARYLVRSGVLNSNPVLPPPIVRPKYIRTAQLAVPLDQAEIALPDLGRTETTLARRQAALRFLMQEPDAINVSWIYAESGCNFSDLHELSERGLIVLRESEVWRDPLVKLEGGPAGLEVDIQPELTPDQLRAWKAIHTAIESSDQPKSPFLLLGVTGSGKTELYLRAASETVRRGRQAIILVPEIAITPQTVRRFLVRFPGQVGLLHSRLSDGERYDTWRRARLGLLKVIIGPRSALFAPLPDIGLIVADECHDSSYYQSEPPFYHAVDAAREYARICGAVCILGSATPTILQNYQAGNGQMVRLDLPVRIKNVNSSDIGAGLPPVTIVDMRTELKTGRRGIFSQDLVHGLEQVLERGQQAILFLNRRGTATYVFCRECGTVAKCPQCDSPLTYHLENIKSSVVGGSETQSRAPELRCHHCGYVRKMPEKCPTCQSNQMRAYGLGSEKVESEAKALFPQARVLRWDWETTRQKDSHEIILSHFAAHRADILVGTQMLAKSLDLPLVTLVGIVLADIGLNLPDPFGPERTFNLLTQVAGRSGRSTLGGQVILQTFQPEHYVIQAASRHDYEDFFKHELQERRNLGYPPFSRLVRLEYRSTDPGKAEIEARCIYDRLFQAIEVEKRIQTDLIGPVPCFFARISGWYRWQIVVRSPDPLSLLRNQKLNGWRVEVDPVSLL